MEQRAVVRGPRPIGVAVISVFLVADALVVLGEAFLDLGSGTRADLLADPGTGRPAVVIGLVVLRVIAAVGLWLGVRRAWVLTMLLVGVSLIVSLTLYWNGEPRYLRMAIDVVLAFYLNQGAVREHFEHARAHGRPG